MLIFLSVFSIVVVFFTFIVSMEFLGPSETFYCVIRISFGFHIRYVRLLDFCSNFSFIIRVLSINAISFSFNFSCFPSFYFDTFIHFIKDGYFSTVFFISFCILD